MKSRKRPELDQEGQALTEYILLIAIVVGIYSMIAAALNRIGLDKKITKPITTSFAAAYRYGHTQAKGYDDGGPAYHPRATTAGANNMRIFFNPEF